MSLNVCWIQAGGRGGDTMLIPCIEAVDVPTLLQALDVDLLWHPSLSNLPPARQRTLRNEPLSRTDGTNPVPEIGVAAMRIAPQQPAGNIAAKADEQLYFAKSNGRNRFCATA